MSSALQSRKIPLRGFFFFLIRKLSKLDEMQGTRGKFHECYVYRANDIFRRVTQQFASFGSLPNFFDFDLSVMLTMSNTSVTVTFRLVSYDSELWTLCFAEVSCCYLSTSVRSTHLCR